MERFEDFFNILHRFKILAQKEDEKIYTFLLIRKKRLGRPSRTTYDSPYRATSNDCFWENVDESSEIGKHTHIRAYFFQIRSHSKIVSFKYICMQNLSHISHFSNNFLKNMIFHIIIEFGFVFIRLIIYFNCLNAGSSRYANNDG